jgi:tetratricopeptide (TPR) repeat protein
MSLLVSSFLSHRGPVFESCETTSRIIFTFATTIEEEIVDMRKAHLLICPVLLLFSPPSFAQENSRSGGAKQEAPKVIATEDMKLAMKAGELETAGKYDEALKVYAQAIDLKGRFTSFVYHNRGMLYLHRAKGSQNRQSRIADLQHAIDDFQSSIRLGAASKDELNRGLEKVATRAHLDEATKLLQETTHP